MCWKRSNAYEYSQEDNDYSSVNIDGDKISTLQKTKLLNFLLSEKLGELLISFHQLLQHLLKENDGKACDGFSINTAEAVHGPFSFCNFTVCNSIIIQITVDKGVECEFGEFASKVTLLSKNLESYPGLTKNGN
ncbi:hypothetical protein K502DRAFT_352124 [Neoconidiobolus thromboides FSU 785]|nr:hypothetical protein K502DRAFT_352124 [Neoconidiobolus thromboides FSU 785]